MVVLGHVVEHVGDIGMARSSDEEIVEAARREDAVVVTSDSDFSSLLAHASAADPSVIRIRIEGLTGDEIAKTVQQVVAGAKPELDDGAAVSVTRAGICVPR